MGIIEVRLYYFLGHCYLVYGSSSYVLRNIRSPCEILIQNCCISLTTIKGWATLSSVWSDIWNVSYIELQIWNQVSHDHGSFERNLSNCEQKPEKVRTSTGFEPVTSRYRCEALTNRAIKPLTLVHGCGNCLNCVQNCDDHGLLDLSSVL